MASPLVLPLLLPLYYYSEALRALGYRNRNQHLVSSIVERPDIIMLQNLQGRKIIMMSRRRRMSACYDDEFLQINKAGKIGVVDD